MMDLSNPGVLLSAGVISMIGLGVFIHGKKMDDVKSLGIGVVLMVFPMFVGSILLMWALAGVCVAGLYFAPRG